MNEKGTLLRENPTTELSKKKVRASELKKVDDKKQTTLFNFESQSIKIKE